MMWVRTSIPCSAEKTAVARTGLLAVMAAAMLALAACAADDGLQAGALGESAELAPYNGLAMAAPPIDDNPDQLLGLSGSDLTSKLGKPALVRREGGAEVWQYRRVRCVLDLFLYGNVKQVEHVDLRDRGDSTDSAVRECFVKMLKRAPATL